MGWFEDYAPELWTDEELDQIQKEDKVEKCTRCGDDEDETTENGLCDECNEELRKEV